MPSLCAWIAASCLTLLASCAPIAFQRQEVHLAHEAEADVLRMLVVYDGIRPNGDDQVHFARAQAFAERVARGDRLFLLFDWPFGFDAEEFLAEDDSEGAGEIWGPWQRELRGALSTLRVRKAGVCVGTQGAHSLHQDFEVKRASAVVELLDRALRLWIEDSASKDLFDQETPWLDDASREAWIAMAKQKRRWLTVDQGMLAVDLPASKACAAKILAELVRHAGEDPEAARVWAALTSHLSELELDHGRFRAAWKLGGPTLVYEPADPGSASTALNRALDLSIELPPEVPSVADVIAAFRKP